MQCFVINKIAKVPCGKDSCVKVSFGYPIRPNYILPQINIKYNYIVKIFASLRWHYLGGKIERKR